MNSNTKDRRTGRERRGGPVSPEVASTRKRERRMGDRRDSPRVPLKLLVRQVDLGGSFEEKDGDISVGGVYFADRHTPAGRQVELRFRLPGRDKEIRCQGEILRVSEGKGRYGAHVRFVDLPTDVELAVARFIDDQLAKK
jgi:hypothetical protein